MSKNLAFEFLSNNLWALEGGFLNRMAKVALREGLEPFNALEAKSGQKISSISEKRGDVAVVHVSGVISRYANMFHAICGGVSTEALSKEFNALLNERSVKSIVLNIDSPGGEASGIHELGEMIYKARQHKPVHAYIGGMGCSAAYWIASACQKVTIDATASVGSIGVVASIVKQEEDEGETRYEFVSSQSPNKRLDIDSNEGQQAIQKQLDETADVFIKCVARNMGVSEDKVLNDFGQGGIAIGKDAVKRGMAKELGSLEGVIAALNSKNSGTTQSSAIASHNPSLFSASSLESNTSEEIAMMLQESFPGAVEVLTGQLGSAVKQAIGGDKALTMAHDAGVPALALKLSGLNEDDANLFVERAMGMRNILAASGLNSSFDALLPHIDDPVKLIGLAIHEARASIDEDDGIDRFITDGVEIRSPGVDTRNVYKNRANANT